MRNWIIIILSMGLSACGTVDTGEDVNFEANISAYSTEAAQIRNDMTINRTELAATVVSAGTQASDFERYNQSLRQTAIVVVPPTNEARIVANQADGPLPIEVYDLSDGQMRFVQIGPAGQVDANACFVSKQQFFSSDISSIYMTAVALNLRAGTTVRADWQFGGELVFSNSWVAPQTEPYRCISLAMSPSDTEFMTGNWSVTLSINGEPTEPRAFTITGG